MAELSDVGRYYQPRGDLSYGGAAAGALTGAAAGATLGPVGAVVGGLVGGVAGLLGSGGGGGPEVPGRVDVMQHWAIANGIIPAGPTAKMSMIDLLARGDPRMLYAAQQQAIYVPDLVKRYSKQLAKWRGGPTADNSHAAAAKSVAFDTSPYMSGGACQCDERPRLLLAQLVNALQAQGVY